MSTGFYSLIQFCPDFSRAEVVNVGVLLLSPEHRYCRALTSSSVQRERQAFGRDQVRAKLLSRSKMAIEQRINAEQFSSPEQIEKFAAELGNELVLTPLRPIRIHEPEQQIEELFGELVGARLVYASAMLPSPAPIQPIERLFTELTQDFPQRAWRKKLYPIPRTQLKIKADYSYRNGRLNLIKTVEFRPGSAQKEAFCLSGEGELVTKHLDGSRGARLIVISKSVTEPAVEQRVAQVFDELKHAEFYRHDQTDELAKKIRTELLGPDSSNQS